nr:retrovirus-related Pol polyprotein from transposon TNT 1-94 [Tanacetum cinerariifolium]
MYLTTSRLDIMFAVSACSRHQVLLIGISYKVMPDLNVLGPLMKDWVLHNAYGALIVYVDRGVHEIEPIIQHLVLNPENLSTAASSSNILSFYSGTVLTSTVVGESLVLVSGLESQDTWASESEDLSLLSQETKSLVSEEAKPTEKHLKKVKRIFHYLRGTINMGLWYTKDSGFELTGFSDADYAGCKDTFKSTSGGAQFLGEKLVSWSSKKQDCMALSTAKAEYVSLSACSIAISCNPVQHSRTKHIAVRYYFIKEHMEKGTTELYFVKMDYQLANLFTKDLPVDRFNYLVHRLVPPKQPTSHSNEIQKPEMKVYCRKPKNVKNIGSSKMAKLVESKNANHSKPNHTWGSIATDIPSSSSLVMTGCPDYTLIARIMRYGDYQLGNVAISRIYYVEELGHNLFSVGQFCDALAKDGLARGIPRLKFQKDHLCSACALRKRKKSSYQPKAKDTNQEKLYLLHMDLCGPIRVASINGKMYILVIVDDYSRFTWTLREFYENVGISHQTSVACTPQQNGWIMAAAVSLSLFLQIDCGRYCIRIPLRRSPRAVRTSVELLLVAFDTELKVFHTPLDDDASCKHSKRDVKSKAFFDCQISQLP